MTANFLIVLELSCRINDLKENIQKNCVYLLMSVYFLFFLLMNGGMFSSDCKLHAGSDK